MESPNPAGRTKPDINKVAEALADSILLPLADVMEKHGISQTTLWDWRIKYADNPVVEEAQRRAVKTLKSRQMAKLQALSEALVQRGLQLVSKTKRIDGVVNQICKLEEIILTHDRLFSKFANEPETPTDD